MQDQILDAEAAAAVFGISKKRMERAFREKEVPATKKFGRWFVRYSNLLKII